MARTQDGNGLWRGRVEDFARHVADLRQRGYEGALERAEKEAVFLRAFEITTPLALTVLDDLSDWYLAGTGTTKTNPPVRDNNGGLVGSWAVTWPLLERDSNRITDGPLPPVTLSTVFPLDWTHPHLALMSGGGPVFAWPFQVTSAEDAARQEPVLRVMAEGEVHDRIYYARSNWAVLPENFGSSTR